MYRAVRAGELARALELHNRLVPVWRSLDGPHFPSRVKYAMALMGRATGRPRGPFTWPSGPDARRIEEALARGGFLAPAGARGGIADS
jgi:4-hydroxy-tetrahydrodipicolinate synthase